MREWRGWVGKSELKYVTDSCCHWGYTCVQRCLLCCLVVFTLVSFATWCCSDQSSLLVLYTFIILQGTWEHATIYAIPLPLLLVVCNTLWYLPLETLLILLPITYLLQHSILQTLKTCIDGGRVTTKPGWHRKLKSEWWSKVVPYFLYACSCGSLDAVKYFIDSGREPNIRYILISAVLIAHI